MEDKILDISNSADFYKKCSDILGLSHNHIEPVSFITRWNNRNPGNGRFEGYGLIRYYNKGLIHVQFGSKGSGVFSNEESVFEFLNRIKNSN